MSIDLATLKLHLRVSGSGQDTILTTYLDAAINWVESYTSQKLEAGAVLEEFTEFGDYLELGTGPAVSITSISYTNAEGDADTVEDARLRDGRIYPPVAGWPGIAVYSIITVAYDAGYSDTPKALDQAVLLLAGHYFQNREAVVAGGTANELPLAVESLCCPYRLPTVR